MRVVVDSNLIVSGLLWSGLPRALLEAAKENRFVLLSSNAMVHELAQVLNRPKFARKLQLAEITTAQLVRKYQDSVIMIEPGEIPSVVKSDPDDDQIIACAVAGHAHYVVTGDYDLLRLKCHLGIPIVTAAEFMKLLSGDQQS
jgi:uncharacterized protein